MRTPSGDAPASRFSKCDTENSAEDKTTDQKILYFTFFNFIKQYLMF